MSSAFVARGWTFSGRCTPPCHGAISSLACALVHVYLLYRRELTLFADISANVFGGGGWAVAAERHAPVYCCVLASKPFPLLPLRTVRRACGDAWRRFMNGLTLLATAAPLFSAGERWTIVRERRG